MYVPFALGLYSLPKSLQSNTITVTLSKLTMKVHEQMNSLGFTDVRYSKAWKMAYLSMKILLFNNMQVHRLPCESIIDQQLGNNFLPL